MATKLPTTCPSQSVTEVLARDKSSPLSLTPSLVHLYAVFAPAYLVVFATNGYDGSLLIAPPKA